WSHVVHSITPDNCWRKTTWPEFQSSLPPGQLAELFGQPVPVILDWYHLVRQEVACVIVRHDANRDRTWCPITSTLGGEIGRQRPVDCPLTTYQQLHG